MENLIENVIEVLWKITEKYRNIHGNNHWKMHGNLLENKLRFNEQMENINFTCIFCYINFSIHFHRAPGANCSLSRAQGLVAHGSGIQSPIVQFPGTWGP